jgi:hypothetical protein
MLSKPLLFFLLLVLAGCQGAFKMEGDSITAGGENWGVRLETSEGSVHEIYIEGAQGQTPHGWNIDHGTTLDQRPYILLWKEDE